MSQRPINVRLRSEDRQKFGEDKYGAQDASYIWQQDFANLICGESGGRSKIRLWKHDKRGHAGGHHALRMVSRQTTGRGMQSVEDQG